MSTTGSPLTPKEHKIADANPIRVALTGSIGMGKSAVANHVRNLGYPVFDADATVHDLYRSGGGAAVEPILAMFPSVRGFDGGVDRVALGKAVLEGGDGALEKLEEVVHPLVHAEREIFYREACARVPRVELVLFDIPLLFEKPPPPPFNSKYDFIVVVHANSIVQQQRVLARVGMTPQRFESIRSKQMDSQEKCDRADFVIDTNDDTVHRAERQMNDIIADLLKRRREGEGEVLVTPRDVLSFWLGFGYDQPDSFSTKDQFYSRMGKWFGAGGVDLAFEKTQMRNEQLVQKAAVAGQLESEHVDWASPEGSLAKIILLDQFSRCIYRGTSSAFQNDAIATDIVFGILSKGPAWINEHYTPVQKFWMQVALQHGESLASQQAAQRMFDDNILTHGATEEMRRALDGTREFSKAHFDVVLRYGRFPGRNAALGRESTVEEAQWLASDDCPSWAKSQLPATKQGKGSE